MKGWVIGGTSGIGAACAKELQKHMIVVSTGLREGDWDVRDRLEIRDILELGVPTHIVYAAGVNHLDWIGKGDQAHTDVIQTNLGGFIRLMNTYVALYEERARYGGRLYGAGPPSIVAISSDAAERPLRTSIGYCASKAGLNMAVRVAARELGPKGWRINAVSPGMTNDTGMQVYVDERVQQVRGWTWGEMMDYEVQQAVVPGRIHPTEVAEVVVQTLMGPAHLNGSIITLNGGR